MEERGVGLSLKRERCPVFDFIPLLKPSSLLLWITPTSYPGHREQIMATST